jgi:hypothetical protein
MWLYPASMLFCWSPSQILAIYAQSNNSYEYLKSRNIVYIFAPLNGLLVSIIFYIKTSEAKIEWITILKKLNLLKHEGDIEVRESTSNEMVVRIREK